MSRGLQVREHWVSETVLAVVIVLIVQIAFPTYAVAADVAACNGSGTTVYRGLGQDQVPSYVVGTRANLDGQSLNHCDPGSSSDPRWASFAWVAIQPSNGGTNDIIQLGRGICKDTQNTAACNQTQRYYSALGT